MISHPLYFRELSSGFIVQTKHSGVFPFGSQPPLQPLRVFRYIVRCSYAGFSKKGYAPYNPRKRNQDALVMAEDASTASVFFAVMDGHGEVGDKVVQVNGAYGDRDQTI